jgi:hypothetical protein
MSIDPLFHPVTALGLPDYSAASLTDEETRLVYIHGELRMQTRHEELVDNGLGVEERARTMWALRCALRTWTRTLMSNTVAAEWLEANEPNRSFDDFVALYKRRSLIGDAVYGAIIASSTKSRPIVDDKNGINREDLPRLPDRR